jgi:hypothetical protein
MRAMPTDAPCEECEAIILEYKRACLDFWLNASQETQDACRAIGHLVGGGSEADVARAQALLRPFEPFRGPVKADSKMGKSRMADVIYRKVQHQSKTGHYVKFPMAKPSSSDLS